MMMCSLLPNPPHQLRQSQLQSAGGVELIGWEPPPFGFTKINTDASVRADGTAGYGGLARLNGGVWRFGFCGYLGKGFEPGQRSVVKAELLGIKAGLRLARQFGLGAVILESDCKQAVDMIDQFNAEQGVDNGSNEIMWHVSECKRLIHMGGTYLIRHKKREGNFCADKMAHVGIEANFGIMVFPSPPAQLIPLLLADSTGVRYPRGTRM